MAWNRGKSQGNNGGSNLCPKCGAALKTSAKGWTYCPRKYNEGNPCSFKGFSAKQGTAVVGTGEIKPLATPSDEQNSIFQRAGEAVKVNLIILALAGTGKSTVLIQLVRIFSSLNLTVLCLAFARRDKENLESKVFGKAKVYSNNGAGMAILSAHARRSGRRLDVENGTAPRILKQRFMEDGLIDKDGNSEISAAAWSTILQLVEKARTCLALAANIPGIPQRPSDDDWNELIARFDLEVSGDELPTVLHYSSFLFAEMASLQNAFTYGVDFAGQTFLPVYHQLFPDTTYDRVLVDETQDQNYSNRQIALLYVRPKTGRIVAVGDENQAIYGWRGADSDAISQMREMMSRRCGGEPEPFPLTLCRRCAKAIIAEAQKIVPSIRALPDAEDGEVSELPDSEALFNELKEQRKGLVLCRANAPLISLCLKLLAQRVPAALVRSDILRELLGMIDRLTEHDDTMPVTDLLERLENWLSDKLAKLAKRANGAGQAQVATDKVACIQALSEEESVKNAGDLKRKIDSLFPKSDKVTAENTVLLSTVHGAKGGEAHTVYLYSPDKSESSIFDQVWSDERDRDNTLYVALTRAEKVLKYVGKRPTLRRFSEWTDGDYPLDSDSDEN